MNSRRAWLVYAVGTLAYVVAVTQRTTIGVAGVAATERYQSDAATLSSLAVLQLLVYAGAQVPVGVLIDRQGPRRLLIWGMAFMVVGQVVVAFSPTIGLAVLGRVILGAGDATVFTSVIRLITSWFRPRHVPLLTQWFANLGQGGQIVSAIPFAMLLNESGWMVAFLSAAACALLMLVAIILFVVDQPADAPSRPEALSLRESLVQLRLAAKRPGTQLGFWTHYIAQSPGTIFALMWGYPFMVYALGYEPLVASSLLVVMVAASAIVGPILGVLSGRFPYRRSLLVLASMALMAVIWTVVLVWSGTPPMWLLIVLLATMGVVMPASMIAFDFARTFNPDRNLGSANGVVNVGGFLASITMIFLIGLVLDLYNAATGGSPATLYSMDGFRVAFLVQYLIVGVGVFFFYRARRATRAVVLNEEGVVVGSLRQALARHWHNRHGH